MFRQFLRSYTTFKVLSDSMPIMVTDSAWNKIGHILNNQPDKWGFMFSAEGGGCSGFNYSFNTIDKNEYSKIYESNSSNSNIKPSIIVNDLTQKNVKIMIEPYSEMFLLGTTIDYIKEDYANNVFESKFVFKPNRDLATTCGCGVSFNPK